ncbi:tetratricopeptide repeat protein [Streptomyces sp. P9(2023)]|uniref:tetratricopeptide repeat protein n=1 Tax=Streptomyces sp. P9(2023) TaxID=3064394 RepID=UPI0028F3FB2A|nr:tetratricopeptide repeat protein [Streptomyces sp. P9(2023)]MDT9687353.1 tetratricopeptide repeat protein [Streptomyces sp. P9(2023)]
MIELAIGSTDVMCDIGGVRTSQPPKAASRRTADLVWRLRREPSDELLWEVGAALADRFLDGPVGRALSEELRRPGPHRIGVEVTDPAVADLPWETLVPPGRAVPLALDPGVDLYRTTRRTGGPAPAATGGPLRIVAAVAAPDDSSGQLLDYEREWARILDAVEPGRRTGHRVRVLEWGSAAAIRSALDAEACDVLHISCHARPGALLLETPTGEEDAVDAARFVRDVMPSDGGVPLIVLAGCSTALEGQAELPGLARSLLDNGAQAVLAMNSVVSDDYAIELCARLYEGLASRPDTDLLTVFSDVRRELAREPRPLPEWATPALFLADPALRPGGGPSAGSRAADPLEAPSSDVGEPDTQAVVVDGTVRGRHAFVGRRRTLRQLAGTEPRVLLHGIGGIGKTSLAAELVRRFTADAADGVVVAVAGGTTVDTIMEQLRRRLGAHCARKGLTETEPLHQWVIALNEPGRDWRELLGAAPVGAAVPLLLVLDNAEDNLDAEHHLVDAELAEFLQAWAERHSTLVTSRYPFPIAGVQSLHLGPLTWQETRKLIWRLPGIDALSPPEQAQVWARLGGHPRSLEYLDALLRDGAARFDEVSARLGAALAGREIASGGGLGRQLHETGALIAQDVLLPELLARLDDVPAARRLLLGAAVYRLPVDRAGLTWQVAAASAAPSGVTDPSDVSGAAAPPDAADPSDAAEPPPEPDDLDEAVARLLHLGLLAPAGDGYLVHRWTAAALARIAGPGRLTRAHRRAGAYWAWRCGTTTAQDTYIGYVLEARFHELAGGRVPKALDHTERACRELQQSGQWAREERLRHEALSMAVPGSLVAAEILSELGGLDVRRGRYAQGESRYRQAMARFAELGAEDLVGAVLHNLGTLAEHRGDHDESERLYRQSMSIMERLGERQRVAITMHQLAGHTSRGGDDRLAEQQYVDALAICEELGDLAGIAAAQHQIGILAFRAKDYVKSERCTRVALSHHITLGDRVNEGNGRIALAKIALERFDHDAAQAEARAALEIFEAIGSSRNIAEACQQLGEISRDAGDLPWAETCFSRAAAVFAALGERAHLAACDRQLGAVRTVLGRAEDAVPCILEAWLEGRRDPGGHKDLDWLAVLRWELGADAFDRIVRRHVDAATADHVMYLTVGYIRLFDSSPTPSPLGTAYVQLAIAANARGAYGTARMLLLRALPVCEASGYPEAVAKCHEDLGLVNLHTGHLEAAERSYRAALTLFEELGNHTNRAIVLHQLGRVCQDRHAYGEAEEYFRASVAVKRALGNQAGVSNSTFHLGRVAQLRGDLELAEQCYRECLAIDEAARAWKEVALDYGELGNLRADQGLPEEAVPLMVRALSLNQQITSDNAVLNLAALRQQRAALGEEEFTRLLGRHFDEASVSAVLTLTATLPTTEGRTG